MSEVEREIRWIKDVDVQKEGLVMAEGVGFVIQNGGAARGVKVNAGGRGRSLLPGGASSALAARRPSGSLCLDHRGQSPACRFRDHVPEDR